MASTETNAEKFSSVVAGETDYEALRTADDRVLDAELEAGAEESVVLTVLVSKDALAADISAWTAVEETPPPELDDGDATTLVEALGTDGIYAELAEAVTVALAVDRRDVEARLADALVLRRSYADQPDVSNVVFRGRLRVADGDISAPDRESGGASGWRAVIETALSYVPGRRGRGRR